MWNRRLQRKSINNTEQFEGCKIRYYCKYLWSICWWEEKAGCCVLKLPSSIALLNRKAVDGAETKSSGAETLWQWTPQKPLRLFCAIAHQEHSRLMLCPFQTQMPRGFSILKTQMAGLMARISLDCWTSQVVPNNSWKTLKLCCSNGGAGWSRLWTVLPVCNEIEELTTDRWCLIGYIRVRIIAREMRWGQLSSHRDVSQRVSWINIKYF